MRAGKSVVIVTVVLLAVVMLALAGCARGPQPIAYGTADCDYCRMRMDDPRFGAEVVTARGKVMQFDAIECMASYYASATPRPSVRAIWVADFEHPGTLIPITQARFIRASATRSVGSPMGRGLLAVGRGADASALMARIGGTELSWATIVANASANAEHGTQHDGDGHESAVSVAPASTPVVRVSPTGAVRSVQAALDAVAPHGTVIVEPGIYRESTIVVSRPVTIVGEHYPVLDGGAKRQIMTITGDSVTVRGLQFANVGVAFTEDLAAIKVVRAHDCAIIDNHVDSAFFGIYLQEAVGCTVRGNTLRASNPSDATSGNGIHLWHARDITIADNHITGHRDGIYFEFVREAHVRNNVSERNLRYGLHFMYSDSCDYVGNTLRHNGAGVAVMYTHNVRMTGNRFEDNSGSSSYGLLLKEIADAELRRNVFAHNTVGLFADGATRLVADRNDFTDNGWALKLESSTEDAAFTRNNFAGNTFDVATNSRSSSNTFRGNYWSSYEGYDLDHDGVGDVAYRPVRLSSVVVARNEPALILLRSTFLGMLDAAERVLPTLTPETLADGAPAMRKIQ